MTPIQTKRPPPPKKKMDIVETVFNDVILWTWGGSIHYLYLLTFHILLITYKRHSLFYAELCHFNVLAQYHQRIVKEFVLWPSTIKPKPERKSLLI